MNEITMEKMACEEMKRMAAATVGWIGRSSQAVETVADIGDAFNAIALDRKGDFEFRELIIRGCRCAGPSGRPVVVPARPLTAAGRELYALRSHAVAELLPAWVRNLRKVMRVAFFWEVADYIPADRETASQMLRLWDASRRSGKAVQEIWPDWPMSVPRFEGLMEAIRAAI